HKITAYVFILIFMVVTEIPFTSITNITSLQSFVIFVSEVLGPSIGKNLLINYFSSVGSLMSSVIYLCIVDLFLFVSPVLASLQWLTKGIVGIATPLFSYMFISNEYFKLTKEYKPYREKADSVFSWMLTCVVSIGMIWFAVGVFPIFPSVIVTGSMEPVIMPGDIALIEKITTNDELEKVKIGDVIQFKRDEILIVHRIVDIVEAEGMICYKTKGDNNSSEDGQLVTAEDIKGKLYKVVPKLGLPTLIYRNNDNINLLNIEF
ncbi:MAG: signal peptidase I, partial [Sedimentibacter sp.]